MITECHSRRARFKEPLKIPTLVIAPCRDIPGSLVKPFEHGELIAAIERAA